MIADSSTWSRLVPGAASMPAKARMPETSASIRSRQASASTVCDFSGGLKLPSIASGRPARLPGV